MEHRAFRLAALALVAVGCGSKSPLIVPDVTTDAPCVPSMEVCNGRDDDCNGLVDDIDRGNDGVTDCLAIAILGNAGPNPNSNFEQWIHANGPRVDRLLTSSAPALTTSLLAQYNVVILDFLTREYAQPERDALAAWVGAGGGLVAMTGHYNDRSSIDRPGSLLDTFGVGYVDGLLDEPVRMFLPHPTVEGITQLPFVGGYRVELRNPPAASHGAQFIARLPEGPAGAALDFGRGRVVVWGDEWIEYDSEWRSMPDVNRFWIDVLGWVSRSR